MSLALILAAIILMALSGLPGQFLPRQSGHGQKIAAGMAMLAAAAGLTGAVTALAPHYAIPATIPFTLVGGRPVVAVDSLSAFFLIPVFLIGGLGSIYGLGYWPQPLHPRTGARVSLFWGLLVAGMAFLLISKNGLTLLLGWETMALAAFFLICTEDQREECRRAGWIYLIATHAGTLALLAMFALWRGATGSYELAPVSPEAMSPGVRNGIFFLALLGFGLKAGAMPLHFWLPAAHANAPSHVSAILSGVVLKIGVYGLVRVLSLLPHPPPVWGAVMLAVAAVSTLLGVVFAIGQHDLKRLLAYHSVENIGIILMGLGLALLGRSFERADWIVLGLAGCLLHVWNHSLFKSLLFFCAGSILHGTGTRNIDRLGGLSKSMPNTAFLFLIGAVAICGLPPLNGFVSEILIYLGLLRGVAVPGGGAAAAIAAPVLAMAGALAVACFVKVYGTVFLGNPRNPAAEAVRESPPSMTLPALMLAVCCVLIGLAPMAVAPVLDAGIANAVPGWEPSSATALRTWLPLGIVGGAATVLALLLVGVGVFLSRRTAVFHRAGTWDCGYAQPSSRMQYTASSFAQMIVGMFGWALRPRCHAPEVKGLFPQPTEMHSHVDDAVLNRTLLPTADALARRFHWFHRFQQGLTQYYVLYILIAVIVLLASLLPLGDFFGGWFAF